MELILISAHSDNLVIGKDNDLPWHLPLDLKHFMRRTKGHAIVMGRRTFESIGSKPLKNRENVVISRTAHYDEVPVYPSLTAALKSLEGRDKVFIVGGSRVYAEALPLADTLYMTQVEGDFDGDTYFPEYRDLIGTEFEEYWREEHEGFTFIDFRRISSK